MPPHISEFVHERRKVALRIRPENPSLRPKELPKPPILLRETRIRLRLMHRESFEGGTGGGLGGVASFHDAFLEGASEFRVEWRHAPPYGES